MRVSIAVLNSKYIHASLAPWCLYAAAEERCKTAELSVVEGTINEPLENFVLRVAATNPEVVGLCCYIWNIEKTVKAAEAILQKCPNAKIVLGGPEVSYDAENILKTTVAHYVISGEGEVPFAALINALEKGLPTNDIAGVSAKTDNGMVLGTPYLHQDMNLPSPYNAAFLKQLNGRIAYLETSRGCPFSCAFCLSGRCGKVKLLPMEQAKQRILTLAGSGAATIKFVDRTFNANRQHCYEIIQFIIAHYGRDIPNGVCFHFEVAGDILEERTIKLLQTAPQGAIQLEIGLQSFYEPTLKAINRKTDTALLQRHIEQLVSFKNMHIHIDLIAGLPLETYDIFKTSFNTAYLLKPNMLQLGFLKLLKGAAMRENQQKYPCVYSKSPPYEVISTPYITAAQLRQLHGVEDALERLYNSGRFEKTVEYLLTFFSAPFDFFESFADYAKPHLKAGINLKDYTKILFDFANTLPINKSRLRDLLLSDLMVSVKNYKVPDFLKQQDADYKKLRRRFEKIYPAKNAVLRSFAILYGQKAAIAVDYDAPNPVTGKYKSFTVPLKKLEK